MTPTPVSAQPTTPMRRLDPAIRGVETFAGLLKGAAGLLTAIVGLARAAEEMYTAGSAFAAHRRERRSLGGSPSTTTDTPH